MSNYRRYGRRGRSRLPGGYLSTAQVAEALRISEGAARRRLTTLGGRKLPSGRLAFPVEAVRAAAGEAPLPRWFPRDPAQPERRRWTTTAMYAAGGVAVVAALVGAVLAEVSGPAVVRTITPSPAATYGPDVFFTFQGHTCRDGWPSRSIGRQGACSHHGGVVAIYRGSDGSELRCAQDRRPPFRGHEQQTQYRMFGELYCR